MTSGAIVLVLAAALLHAVWNAFVKASSDRVLTMAMISMGHVVLGLMFAALAPIPSMESWPYLAVSSALHWAYYFFLIHSYRAGDLSLVYPVARGLAPVVVACTAVFAADERLPHLAWLGIFCVTLAIMFLAARGMAGTVRRSALVLAIATGICIASYSLVDGLGVRTSGSALGYIAWLFLLEIFVVIYILSLRWRSLPTIPQRDWLAGLAGGLVSAVAYGIVLHVKEFSPLGLVSALRETSVVIASLIGVAYFGERPWISRVPSAFVVAAGVALIALAK